MSYIPIVPPKKAQCFQCTKDFYIKFVVPHKSYSKKNNWGYWTNQPQNQGKYICDSCLRKLYYNKKVYWPTITDLKRRAKLTTYIYDGVIS